MNVLGQLIVSEKVTNPYNSDISTRDTIELMTLWARQGINSVEANRVLDSLGLCGKSEAEKIERIYYWVKSHLKFQNDEETNRQLGFSNPDYKELLIDPRWLAKQKTKSAVGDCDDYSMLLAMLVLTEIPSLPLWFVTIATDKATPNRWSHVYVATQVDGRLVSLDSSHGNYPGWEAENNGYQVFRKEYWRVN